MTPSEISPILAVPTVATDNVTKSIWRSALDMAASPFIKPFSTAQVLAQGVGKGAASAGEGIKQAVTSVSSGVKWGLAAVIFVVALYFLAPVLGAIKGARS